MGKHLYGLLYMLFPTHPHNIVYIWKKDYAVGLR